MSKMMDNIAANNPLDEKVVERREALLRDWKSFERGASPFLVAEVIERRKVWIPDDLAPWAPGIVLAADYLLHAANYAPGARLAKGWSSRCKGSVYLKFLDHRSHLIVRQSGRFWTVERSVGCEGHMLAYRFGPLPIFTRTCEAATRLAEYCSPCPRGAASSLHWVFTDPAKFFGVEPKHELPPSVLKLIATKWKR